MRTGKFVWVIEDGEYSDYRVVRVFSSKKNAEVVQAKTGGDIAKWPLDPAVDHINAGKSLWSVVMRRDGTVERCDTDNEMIRYSVNDEEQHHIWYRSKVPAYKGKNVEDVLTSVVWAKTGKHAIKITNEQRTKMIATGEWK